MSVSYYNNTMDFFKSILQKIEPTPKAAPAPAIPAAATVIPGVPSEYAPAVMQASQHTGYPATTLANHFASENGGNWDPTLKGKADPSDFGITQLNPTAVQTITGGNGGRNYFKDNFGHEFNPANGNDQILASAVYLNWLKQFGLPAAGIKNPTPKDVFTSYNTGATGYAKTMTPNAPQARVQRARTYQNLLAKNGNKF